ncbi:MAG: hypothetical protein WAW36_14140 [Methylovulum miyakonense]|uniref:hypothetical protein n=1 Tax=Methylovulum miyakonense TaxID=645578 RepID=UPI003BB4F3B4
MLLTCLLGSRGRANYTNLGRHSSVSEKAFRRWFGKKLDFIEFNRIGNREAIPLEAEKVAALDASFVSKSGGKTYGLGYFYNGKQGKAETGLEISTLAIVDVDFNTAYQVSTRQAPVKTKDADGSPVASKIRRDNAVWRGLSRSSGRIRVAEDLFHQRIRPPNTHSNRPAFNKVAVAQHRRRNKF